MRKLLISLCLTALVAVLSCPLSFAAYDTVSYRDWMTQHKEALRDLPINKVPILGSHDSGSCDVHVGSEPCKGYLTHSGHHIKRKARAQDVESAVCQSASIMDQLLFGVRCLDMRTAWQDGQYWTSHMWMSTRYSGKNGIFAQIKDFLKQHPDEIIIMRMEHCYSETNNMTTDEMAAWFARVQAEFHDKLVPVGDFSSTTLGSIWSGPGRIIIVGDSTADYSDKKFVWDENAMDNRWMDVPDPDVLCADLTKILIEWQNGTNSHQLHVLEAMVTAGHKLTNAAVTNGKTRALLVTDWQKFPLNIIQVDDAVNSGLMPVLIDRLH